MMKWYENHRHNWSYCHDLRFWISFYFLCGWEAVEYGEIPPFCVYAICLNHFIIKTILGGVHKEVDNLKGIYTESTT